MAPRRSCRSVWRLASATASSSAGSRPRTSGCAGAPTWRASVWRTRVRQLARDADERAAAAAARRRGDRAGAGRTRAAAKPPAPQPTLPGRRWTPRRTRRVAAEAAARSARSACRGRARGGRGCRTRAGEHRGPPRPPAGRARPGDRATRAPGRAGRGRDASSGRSAGRRSRPNGRRAGRSRADAADAAADDAQARGGRGRAATARTRRPGRGRAAVGSARRPRARCGPRGRRRDRACLRRGTRRARRCAGRRPAGQGAERSSMPGPRRCSCRPPRSRVGTTAPAGRPLSDLVLACEPAMRAHLDRVLADTWLVNDLGEVPDDAPGLFVTPSGDAWRPARGVRQRTASEWAVQAEHRTAVARLVEAERALATAQDVRARALDDGGARPGATPRGGTRGGPGRDGARGRARPRRPHERRTGRRHRRLRGRRGGARGPGGVACAAAARGRRSRAGPGPRDRGPGRVRCRRRRRARGLRGDRAARRGAAGPSWPPHCSPRPKRPSSCG